MLFVIDLATRRVEIAGITTSPHAAWMRRMAINLTDPDDGFLKGKRFLILDRDGKFCPKFLSILRDEGITPLRLPPRSPNLNAFAERFVRSTKEECLDRMIFFGEDSLHNAVTQYVVHYHGERNHQGLDNRIIDPAAEVGQTTGALKCRKRLGGMLKYYYREAA